MIKYEGGFRRKLLYSNNPTEFCGYSLKGRQIVKYAPWMISPEALNEPGVQAAVAKVHAGSSLPPAEPQTELLWQPKADEV